MAKERRKARGFTLLELMVVVVIIGILAGLALPNYTRMKESVLGDEAIANLNLIAAAEKIYRLESENQSYCACICLESGTGPNGCEGDSGCNALLKLQLVTENWTYQVFLDPTPDSFKVDADRQGTGGYLDCVYTMTNTSTEPVKGEFCP